MNIKKRAFEFPHGKPVTRRDFISCGLMAGAAITLRPTVIGSLVSAFSSDARAQAEEVPTVPLFVIDLAGGASLPGNFLVGGAGGPEDLLSSYSRHGWDPHVSGSYDTRFGLPIASPSIGMIAKGMLDTLSAEAQAKLRMGSILHKAEIDTDRNPLNILSLVARRGLSGSAVPQPLGTKSTVSGGNSRSLLELQEFRAAQVEKLTDLSEAVGFAQVFKTLPVGAREKLARLVRRLSSAQASEFLNAPASRQALEIVDKGYSDFHSMTSKSVEFDPRKDKIFSEVFRINPNTSEENADVIRAAMTRASLTQLSGPSTIVVDGCDYHVSNLDAEAKDLEIGTLLGRIVESAHRLGTAVFLQIITDGGIYAPAGSRLWEGDDPSACMTVLAYYDPKGPAKYRDPRSSIQIGRYREQAADIGFHLADNKNLAIADSPELAAIVSYANYLNICGLKPAEDEFVKRKFLGVEVEQALIFEPTA